MNKPTVFVNLIFLVLCSICFSEELDIEQSSGGKRTVTIKKWEYCLGCKYTVEAYANVASKKIQDMEKEGHPTDTRVDAATIGNNICDAATFGNFETYIQHSCIKIMTDHSLDFLKTFEGSLTSSIAYSKGEMFSRARDICVNKVNACPDSDFQRANISASSRSPCAACAIIVEDIETLYQIAYAPDAQSIIDGVCDSLGYGHSPSSWLESHCHELIDDHEDAIYRVLKGRRFRDSVKKLRDMTPERVAKEAPYSLHEKICKKLLRCESKVSASSNSDEF